MRKFLISLTFCLLQFTLTHGQRYEFGQVTVADLQATEDAVFGQVDAVVLHRDVYSTIGDVIEVYEKIKILTKEGTDYGTFDIPYYDIKRIKGFTYNLEDGQIVTHELDKKNIFMEKDEDALRSYKITFPQVKQGSIIELRYESPKGTAANIDLQYEIPIRKLRAEVYNNTRYTYRITQNPMAFLNIRRIDQNNTVIHSGENIPPVREVSYVYDMDLYFAHLRIERLGVNNYIQVAKWEDFPKIMLESDDYNRHLEPRGIYKDDISKAISGLTDSTAVAKAVYDLVQNTIEWDGRFGIFPDLGTRFAYRNKTGDVSDLNMMYVSMMRSLGYEAYPVLSSTKSHGLPLSASQETFNYTLAAVKLGGKYKVVDCAEEDATFDYLPQYALNGAGLMMKNVRGDYQWLNLEQPKISNRQVFVDATLSEDLTIEGKGTERRTGYFGIDFNSFLKDRDVEKTNLVDYDFLDLELSNEEVKPSETKESAVFSYDFYTEEAVEEIGQDYYLLPSLFLAFTETPFQEDERYYPIDYVYTHHARYMTTVKIPEGYRVSFTPEPVRLILPDGLGSYSYTVQAVSGGFQVLTDIQIKKGVIAADFYPELKALYAQRVAKESEKIVISPNP